MVAGRKMEEVLRRKDIMLSSFGTSKPDPTGGICKTSRPERL